MSNSEFALASGPAYSDVGRAGLITKTILFIGGFVWGATTAFAMSLADENTSGMYIQGIGLLTGLTAVTVVSPSFWWQGLRTKAGLLISMHVLAAVLSTLLCTNVLPSSVVRYVAMLPAILIMCGVVLKGRDCVASFRLGLTVGTLSWVFSILGSLNYSQLLNPHYRYYFASLNTNGVGFIAAMCGVSVFDYAVTWWRKGKMNFPIMFGVAMLVGACGIVLLATKSRTATLTLIVGIISYCFFTLGAKRSLLYLAVAIVLAFGLTIYINLGSLGDRAADIFELTDKYRSISTGTGRFVAYPILISQVWLPNFFFGIGPGNSYQAAIDTAGIPGAHNGLLINLCEVGFIGTLPLVIWVIKAFRNGWRARFTHDGAILLALVIAALVESMAETMFFSIGNPGSLLFLLSATALLISPPPPPLADSDVEQSDHEWESKDIHLTPQRA